MSGQDDRAEMERFVAEKGVTEFEHIADVTNVIWRAFTITAQPSYVFIDDNGEVRRHVGGLTAERIEEELKRLD